MSKISYKNTHGLVITVENPDRRITADIGFRLREALEKEQSDFISEVGVVMRRLKPGQKRILRSKPITVEIESVTDEIAFPAP